MAKSNFGSEIKKQLIALNIKSPCCKQSFITGTEVFAKSRKNEFTDALGEYKARLSAKKKRSFFDEQVDIGYQCTGEDGQRFPVSHGRVCQYCHAAMLRGAFMVCGRANRSDSDIHLEMSMPSERAADIVAQSLSQLGLPPKKTCRRGEILLYYKKREAVSDLVAYLGAVSLSFDIINDSILKERRAVANRQKNCDTTNIMKSISAAERQLEAINALVSHGALDELPSNLKETARIRLENPIESLDEITELHGGAISKSGVNHRLARLIEIAEKKGYTVK